MPAKQRMRVQNEKHSKNVNIRGNVPKTEVQTLYTLNNICTCTLSHRKRTMRVILLDPTCWLCLCL